MSDNRSNGDTMCEIVGVLAVSVVFAIVMWATLGKGSVESLTHPSQPLVTEQSTG